MSNSKTTRLAISLPMPGGETLPAILQLPAAGSRVAAVLLLHGFSSRKERMADSIGQALLTRNVGSLAIDLPLHGARDAGIEGLSFRNPLALVQKWQLAVREANAAIQYLAKHASIDAGRIAIAGYSLGAYLATTIAGSNTLVRAVALAAGGDLPAQTPLASLVRSFADPLRSVRALDGRPLLMINGRFDNTVRPEQARALFAAAGEPKELRWYDGGHWPPQSAIDAVADWLAERLKVASGHSRLA
jgi:predicted esterase